MNLKKRKTRLGVAAIGACVIGFFGFVGFLQNIHNPTSLSKTVQTIGLPLFEVAMDADLPFIALAGSAALWIVIIYAVITVVVTRKCNHNAT